MSTIIYTIKDSLFSIAQFLFGICLSLRFSFLCIVLIISNMEFLKLLIPVVFIDILLDKIIASLNHNINLEKYIHDIEKNKLKTDSILDNDFVIDMKNEISKYQFFKWGNKLNQKQIYILRANSNNIDYLSYPIFNGTSYIIVPENTDTNDQKQKIRLAHEIAHCLNDDISYDIISHIKLVCMLYPCLVILYTGLSIPSLICVVLAFLLYIMQFWCETYSEIKADNTAIEMLESINNPINKKESIKQLLLIKNIGLRYTCKKLKGLSQIKKKISLKNQIEFLEMTREYGTLYKISPINYPIGILLAIIILVTLYYSIFFLHNCVIPWKWLLYSSIMIILQIIVLLFINKKEKIKRWKISNLLGQK